MGSPLERKMAQVALLLKNTKLAPLHTKPSKLAPLTKCKEEEVSARFIIEKNEISIETEVREEDAGIFYCYQCFQGRQGEPTWTTDKRDKNFCSWECQLEHQTEIAKIKHRRSELMLLNVTLAPEQENQDGGDSQASSPCISPLHELTILRIK